MDCFYIFSPGCLNGGGQLRPEGEEAPKDLLEQVQNVYNSLTPRSPWSSMRVQRLYTDWLGGQDTETALKHLHTSYHAVEKMSGALNIKW